MCEIVLLSIYVCEIVLLRVCDSRFPRLFSLRHSAKPSSLGVRFQRVLSLGHSVNPSRFPTRPDPSLVLNAVRSPRVTEHLAAAPCNTPKLPNNIKGYLEKHKMPCTPRSLSRTPRSAC